MTAPEIVNFVAGIRLTLTNEKRMQRELAQALDAAGVTYERERRLNRRDVVDFMLADGVAVECKLRESKMAIFRQLRRYAQHPDVRAIVLVSNTAMGLPPEIEGKPAYYCSLGAAWL